MQKNVQQKNVQVENIVPSKSANNWNDAICEAKRLIKEETKKIAQLRQSIGIFERLRDEGMPFPGKEADQGKDSEA